MQNSTPDTGRYRWVILALAALTNTLGTAIPSLCLPVLFKEISADLDLSLDQLGDLWGISALPGVVMMLAGGMLGDKFGPRRVLIAACLLSGLTGALRGISTDYYTLMATMLLFGFATSVIPMNVFKTCGLWFSKQQLGLASGVVSMGMALGFMLGSMISATVMSPWLGGWRQVLLLYGILAALLSIPWYFTRPAPQQVVTSTGPAPLRQTIAYVARIKKMWLMGWAILGIGGATQATLGYLPLYLEDSGWSGARAGAAAASFHLMSMVFVIPIALWSDRLGSRKKVALRCAMMTVIGFGLLSFVKGIAVWPAVGLAGMVRDGFMAVFLTMVLETEGIGPKFAGTASGLVMVFSGVGSLIAPPLGIRLEAISPSLPFLFWSILALVGVAGLYAAQEGSPARVPAVQPVEPGR